MADITRLCGDTKFLFKCWKIFYEWAQRTSEIFFQLSKRNFVSKSGHSMFYSLFKHHWNTKLFHFLHFFFCERRDLLCSHSNRDISRVKMTCYFQMWRYHVFARKITGYFIGVYKINNSINSFHCYARLQSPVIRYFKLQYIFTTIRKMWLPVKVDLSIFSLVDDFKQARFSTRKIRKFSFVITFHRLTTRTTNAWRYTVERTT